LASARLTCNGDWHASALDQLFDRVISHDSADQLGLTAPLAFLILAARLQNRQSLSRVFDVAKVHYDLPMENTKRRMTAPDGQLRLLATTQPTLEADRKESSTSFAGR